MSGDSRYDLIIFDWDGTLMDSASAIARSIIAACHDLELPAPSEARARHVIGLGLQEALTYAVPALSEAHYPRMVERYRYHYLAADRDLTLFPGVQELVAGLAAEGRMLGVATGKSRKGLDRALGRTELAAHFASTRCADECFSKPHPEMLEQIMDELGVERKRTLMVGDTTHDLNMARNAGVDGLAVAFGAHPRAALEALEPLAVLDSPAAYTDWFRCNL